MHFAKLPNYGALVNEGTSQSVFIFSQSVELLALVYIHIRSYRDVLSQIRRQQQTAVAIYLVAN